MQIYLNKNSVESLEIRIYNSGNLLRNCLSFLCHTCHNTCAIQSTGQTLRGKPNWCSFNVLHRPILGTSSEMISIKIICLRESQETYLFLAPTGIRKHFHWIIKPICIWNLCLSHVLNKVCIFLLYLHMLWNRIFRCPQVIVSGWRQCTVWSFQSLLFYSDFWSSLAMCILTQYLLLLNL